MAMVMVMVMAMWWSIECAFVIIQEPNILCVRITFLILSTLFLLTPSPSPPLQEAPA